jgi:hypothetical protein
MSSRAVGWADFVVEPDEWAAGCHRDQKPGLPMLGAVAVRAVEHGQPRQAEQWVSAGEGRVGAAEWDQRPVHVEEQQWAGR